MKFRKNVPLIYLQKTVSQFELKITHLNSYHRVINTFLMLFS